MRDTGQKFKPWRIKNEDTNADILVRIFIVILTSESALTTQQEQLLHLQLRHRQQLEFQQLHQCLKHLQVHREMVRQRELREKVWMELMVLIRRFHLRHSPEPETCTQPAEIRSDTL